MMIDVVVKATLVLGVATVFGAVSRGRVPASVRHAAWVAALLGAVLVPALGAWLPAIRVPLLPAELRPVAVAAMTAPATAPAGGPDATPQAAVATGFDSTAATGSLSDPSAPMREAAASAMPPDTREFARRIRDTVAGMPWLTLIWAAGAVLVLIRLVASRLAVARLTRSRVPGRKPWLGLARRLARVMRVPRRLRFMRSDRISMPIACGVLRPTVVLPVEADHWQDGRIRAVLLHELAHVRRRDCLTQLLVDGAVALLWFHPLAWAARRAVRRERERACDDLVLAAGTEAPEYATHLLDVARAAQGQPSRLVMSGGVAMARASELEGRLMAILDSSRARHALTARTFLTLSLATVAIVAPMSALDLWHAPGVAAGAVLESPTGRPTPAPKTEAVRLRSRTVARAERQEAGATTLTPVAVAPSAVAGPTPTPKPTPTPTPAAAPMAWKTAEMGPGSWKMQEPAVAGIKGGVIAGGPAKVRRSTTPADPRVIAALTEALKDSDLEVRQQALFTLGRYGDPSSLDAMIGALGDTDAEMRQQAAFALRQYDNPRARQALATALKDGNAEVRQQAAFSLGAQRSSESVDALVGALKDADTDVRKQAAFALAQIRDPRAADALMVAAKDGDAEVRAQAFFGLSRLGDARAQELAIAALKDSSPEVRRIAAMALANLAGQEK